MKKKKKLEEATNTELIVLKNQLCQMQENATKFGLERLQTNVHDSILIVEAVHRERRLHSFFTPTPRPKRGTYKSRRRSH